MDLRTAQVARDRLLELDEDTRKRLCVEVSSTAAPELRVAIETAAEGADDEELAEALEAMDEARS